jgi:hypothetical protein
MNALMILSLSIIAILGFIWQIALYRKDSKNGYDIKNTLRGISLLPQKLYNIPDSLDYVYHPNYHYNNSKFLVFFFNFQFALKLIPKRIVAPFILGILLIIGTLMWMSITLLVDPKSTISLSLAVITFGKVLFLVLVFTLKSYIGPVITCFVSCVAIYNLFTYNQLETILIIQPLIDWIFDFFPNWVKYIYWGIFLLNSAGMSIIEIFDNQ